MGHHLVTFLIFLNTPHPPKLHETSAHRDSARLIHTLWPWAVASARSIGEAQWYGRRRGARHPALEAPREAMVVVFSTKESGEFWRKTQGFLKNRFGKMEMMQRLVRKQGFYTQTQGFNSGAFWSIDVYKCHKLRDMNVCVCYSFMTFFSTFIFNSYSCVCVCFNYLFIFNSSLNAPRTGIVGAQVTVAGVCRGVFGPSLSICTDWLRIPPGKQVAN